MKPTSEQCNQWFDAWVENESESISARLYIAQRAAEWAFEEAAKICDRLDACLDHLHPNDCAEAIRKEIDND